MVDGQENTASNIYTQKMHEVQKYLTMTNHGYIGYVVVVNKKFWDGLPADIRGQLEKAMKEATAFGNGQSAKENDEALEAIKKAGKTEIVTLTPEQDAAMRKAMEPVYKESASRVGQPLIDEFIKETGGVTPLPNAGELCGARDALSSRRRRAVETDRSRALECDRNRHDERPARIGCREGERCCFVSLTGSRKS